MTTSRGVAAPDLNLRILTVRGDTVILDADLAAVYGVEPRVLNQAVKRNAKRFPPDFAFRLSQEEAQELRASRSHPVILKRGGNLKYLPWAFTEHGAIMAASVLSSVRAVEMSVFVVRAFVRLRGLIRTHVEIGTKLAALERKVAGHDQDLKRMFAALRTLLESPPKPRRAIGFRRSPMNESRLPGGQA